jgi:hypothetical protein
VPIPADLAGLVADTKPVRYAWDLLRMGTKLYVDREYPLTAIASCDGHPFLRTACDDKKRKVEETVVSFELKREATVLVAMDNRVPKPSWLSDFKDTGEDIAGRHRNGTFTYRLWARDHPPGRVTLGGIASNDAMYIVILRPKGGVALDAGTTSAPAGLEPPEGTFLRAVNLNGPELTVDGNRWESGLRAENCLAYGQAVDDRVTTPAPEVDAVFARVLQSGFRGANKVRILLGGVERGTYRVYLYVRDGQAKFGVRLEGKQVKRSLTCGAGGAWERIGPMEAEVTDGALEVKMVGRPVSVCGIELWEK